MGRNQLISKLNTYYEEISKLNKELERLLREQSPSTQKIQDVMNKKDFFLQQCIVIKNTLENESSTDDDYQNPETENKDLIEEVLKQDKINQELLKESLYQIKDEIKDLKINKNKVKYYQQNENNYGKLNKKG